MINVSDLKAGMTFILDGKLIKVLEISHRKPGKGTVMHVIRDVRNEVQRLIQQCVLMKSEERAHIDTKRCSILATAKDGVGYSWT